MIAIVDYGSGNIRAISNAYTRLGVPFFVASRPEDLERASRVLLPGVGAFDQAMSELERSGMKDGLGRAVLDEEKPILGICVGMQLLANRSEEGKKSGLRWIEADVCRFDPSGCPEVIRLPHMGWNTISPTRSSPLFDGVGVKDEFYFLHSYYFCCSDSSLNLATAHYGISFAAAVNRRNIYGIQFHPEKSHGAGMRVLKNFATHPGIAGNSGQC